MILIIQNGSQSLDKKNFARVVEECERIDLLDNLDKIVLVIYCNAYYV